jgi:hypothetical protein
VKRFSISMLLMVTAMLRPSPARAQMRIERIDDPPRAAAYMEFGGNTGEVSLNLDVLVAPHTSVRAGGFLVAFDSSYWNGLIMVNQLFGTGGNYVETGAGFVAAGGSDRATASGATLSLGYRRQTRQTFFRVGAASTAGNVTGRGWHPVIAISGGRTF